MYGNLAAVSGAAFGRDGVMLRFEFSFWAWGDRDRRCSSAWSFICFPGFLLPLHLYVCDLFWCSFASVMLRKEAVITSPILLVYQALAFMQWHNCYSSLIPVLLKTGRELPLRHWVNKTGTLLHREGIGSWNVCATEGWDLHVICLQISKSLNIITMPHQHLCE